MSIGTFSSLTQGGPSPEQSSDQRTALATIARAPSSSSESLFVVVPGFSLAFPYEVISSRWEHASNLPAAGTSCLVVFDDNGDAWVPLWEGMVPGGGIEGPAGPTGPQGPPGATGAPGAAGPAGPQGLPGVAGPQGQTGAQGPKGDQGAVGPQGPIGATGAAGAVGPQGPVGAAGPSGASTFLSGVGAPSAGVGVDGSVYLALDTLELWGPKAAGAWPGAAFARLMPLTPTWAQVKTG